MGGVSEEHELTVAVEEATQPLKHADNIAAECGRRWHYKNEGLIMNACWAEVGRPREGSGGRLGTGERGW